MVYFAPCKINLGLNITSKRNDGYHDIQSVMVPVFGLADIVEVLENSDGDVNFFSTGLFVDCPKEDNLCVKAYREFAKNYKVGGVDIHLHKIVPFGAGLGGGSSDAAYVIIALNKIFNCGASIKEMEYIAAAIGSDTSFFVESRTKMCEGRGEIFSPIDLDLKGLNLSIVKPNIFISTKEAYSGVTPHLPSYNLRESLLKDVQEWKGVVVNDFEEHLLRVYPELLTIKNRLYELGASYVSLSGSGSSIFALSNQKLDLEGCDYFDSIFKYETIL